MASVSACYSCNQDTAPGRQSPSRTGRRPWFCPGPRTQSRQAYRRLRLPRPLEAPGETAHRGGSAVPRARFPGKEQAILRNDGNPYSGGYAALLQDGLDYSWSFGMLTFSQYAKHHAVIPWPSMLGSSIYAAAIALLYSYHGATMEPLMGLSAIQQFLAAPLGFVMSFRVNQAYNRWWDCRQAIGGVVTGATELGSIAACSGMKDKDLHYILSALKGLLRACCHSLHSRMPQSEKNAELSDDLDEETAGFLSRTAVSGLTTNFDSLLFLIRCEIVKRIPSKEMVIYNEPVMTNVSEILGNMGICTSVFITPPPLSYTIHLRLLLSLYIASMPFFLCTTISPWLVPPVTAVAAFAFFGLDALSTAVAGPFGRQKEDLPVGDYVQAGISKLDRVRTLRENLPSAMAG